MRLQCQVKKIKDARHRKELDKAGFEIASKPAAWEHFAFNADTMVVVTNVPLSASKTYVHVLATSNADASARNKGAALMKGHQGKQNGAHGLMPVGEGEQTVGLKLAKTLRSRGSGRGRRSRALKPP